MKKIPLVVAYVLSLIMVLATLLVIYLKIVPVNVLMHWKLTVVSGTYYPGDTVSVHSEADKTKPITPLAHRNIECKSNGNFISYHLADVKGVNAKVGHISTYIDFDVPQTIPNLPTTCRFSISIDYKIDSFREVNEYTFSNTFTVDNKPVTVSAPALAQNTSLQSVENQNNSPPSTLLVAPPPTGSTLTTPVETCAVNVLFIKLGCNERT